MTSTLPVAPPFVVRARLITPRGSGDTLFLPDARVEVDGGGRIADVSAWPADELRLEALPVFDLRPWVVLPGLVDLHVHIPQLPNAGVGDGLDLIAWLRNYTLPLEARFDRATAERVAPLAFEAMAAAGTTTAVAYVTADPDATDAVFEAARAHGIRLIAGLVLTDRPMAESGGRTAGGAAPLRASETLCAKWHGQDAGRLGYAFTPRFAVSCSGELLRESVRLAAESGAFWQTHLAEDRRELEEVRAAFPDARDYLDVYERAGSLDLGPAALFAHAVHLSPSEVERLAAAHSAIAHCPASNLFLASGIMPLAHYLRAGLEIGLGSDVSGGPSLSIFETMRVGSYSDTARRTSVEAETGPRPGAFDWLRLGTLGGAEAIGLGGVMGSLEPGKEADFIAVDAALTEPLPGCGAADEPQELISRLIFRTHPEMVIAAWVRGRALPGARRTADVPAPRPVAATPARALVRESGSAEWSR